MNVFKHLLIVSALAATAAAYAVEPDPGSLTLAELLADETASDELFAMCCWAKGRAGFHYCEQYGICESDPDATCKGIGAAEGRTMSCKSAPPAKEEQRG